MSNTKMNRQMDGWKGRRMDRQREETERRTESSIAIKFVLQEYDDSF